MSKDTVTRLAELVDFLKIKLSGPTEKEQASLNQKQLHQQRSRAFYGESKQLLLGTTPTDPGMFGSASLGGIA